MRVQFDHAFGGIAVGALGSRGQAFLAQEINGFVEIAIGLFQGLAAVQDASAGGFAQFFDLFVVIAMLTASFLCFFFVGYNFFCELRLGLCDDFIFPGLLPASPVFGFSTA